MGAMGWHEVCRKCGGDAAVEMTLAGDAMSACGFCGLLEQWKEPDGEVHSRGGNGCATVALKDTKTVCPGMSARALTEAWRRTGTGAMARRLSRTLEALVVTWRAHGSKGWSVSIRKGRWISAVWYGPLRDARVVAGLMVSGHWSERPVERVVQRRLAIRRLDGRLTADLARSRLRRKSIGSGVAEAVEADDEWGEVRF